MSLDVWFKKCPPKKLKPNKKKCPKWRVTCYAGNNLLATRINHDRYVPTRLALRGEGSILSSQVYSDARNFYPSTPPHPLFRFVHWYRDFRIIVVSLPSHHHSVYVYNWEGPKGRRYQGASYVCCIDISSQDLSSSLYPSFMIISFYYFTPSQSRCKRLKM